MNRRLRKILVRSMIFILVFLAALYIVFNSAYVQTKITQAIGNYFGNKWGTRVSIDRIYLEPFQRLSLRNLYIEDQHGDTLIFTSELLVNFKRIQFRKNKISIDELILDKAHIELRKYKGEEKLNLAFIINTFKSRDNKVVLDSTSAEPINIQIDDLEILNSHLVYQNQNKIDTSNGMHYADLEVSRINGLLSDISIISDSINFNIESLNATEKCGVVLNSLETQGYINGKRFDLSPVYISMNNSIVNADRLKFTYNEWINFPDFISKVHMLGEIQLAKISMQDIAYFAPALDGWKQEFTLVGKIDGTVENLSGYNLRLSTGDKTTFKGDFNMDGLPDFSTTFISVVAKEFSSEASDLENIQIYPFKEGKKIEVPKSLKDIGSFKFKGDFTGFANDFVAFGSLKSKMGELKSDVSLKQLENNTLLFTGSVKSKNVDLGVLIDQPMLGKLDADLFTEMLFNKGKFQRIKLEGEIDRLGFNNYNYRNIKLNGLIEPGEFTGVLTSRDPALDLDFEGNVSINTELIVLNFDANLLHADLGALHFLPIKSYSSLIGDMNLNLVGKEWTELIGRADITSLDYCTDSTTFSFGEIYLRNDTIAKQDKLILSSDVLNATIEGEFDIASIYKDIKWELGKSISSFFEYDSNYVANQDFTFDFIFHDLSFLQELDVFDLSVSPETRLFGNFSPIDGISHLHMYSDSIIINGFSLNYPDLSVVSNGDMHDLEVSLNSETYQFLNGPEYFRKSRVEALSNNDSLLFEFNWLQDDSTEARVVLNTHFNADKEFSLWSDDSRFSFLNKEWRINNNGHAKYDSLGFHFSDVEVYTQNQSLKLNGLYGGKEYDSLYLEVNNFELNSFNYILQQFDYQLNGLSNGYFNWSRENHILKLEAELQIDSTQMNDYYLGDIKIASNKLDTEEEYHVDVRVLDKTLEKLKIDGTITPSSDSDQMDLMVNFDQFDLKVLNYTNIPGISQIKGKTNGEVNIYGSIKKPNLKGHIDIIDASLFLEVLGTSISFSNNVNIYEDYIALDPFEIRDKNGKKGIAYGTVLHENLKNWNYDLSFDIDDFMVMDLKNNIDALFYGKAYASGNANIWGFNKKLFIDVNATTEKNTNIIIPVKESSTVERKDFIEFISPDSLSNSFEDALALIDISGVEMTLNVDATPDAQIALVFDEAAGDILKVRAEGPLILKINEKDGFTMQGSLETAEGEYVFTFEGIINKKFDISAGSKISWLGDPYEANIDIRALYKTRAALSPIMIGEEDSYQSRVNVFVILDLVGNLQAPTIRFGIELPDSEEKEKTALRSATSTTEDMNKQVVSLLLFNSFQSTSGWDESGGFATTNTFELLSNQVSNWLSQISDEVDINVHYRPGSKDANTGQEIDVGLTTDILDERVSITTQVGFKDQSLNTNPNANANTIVGDFIIEYKLTKDGRIRLKAFNKSNDNQNNATLYKEADYVQGIGIVIRKDFDNKMKRKPSNKEKLQEKYDTKKE